MNTLCSVKRLNFEDCEERYAHYRLDREGKKSFNLRPQKMADFLGLKTAPFLLLFSGRENGAKNIIAISSHRLHTSFDQAKKIVVRRPKPKEAKLWTKKDFCPRDALLSSIHNFSPTHAFASSFHFSLRFFFSLVTF